MLEKHIYTEIWNESGTTLLSLWRDLDMPRFQYDQQGIQEYTFTLARQYGMADAPGDINSRDSLKTGNQILVRVADSETMLRPVLPGSYAIAGVAVPGQMIFGNNSGFSKTIYGGNILSHEYQDSNVVKVETISFASLLEIPINEAAPFTLVGDPVEIARFLIEKYAGQALTWDTRNPARCNDEYTPYSLSIQPGPLSLALEDVRKICGPDWFCYVTPNRTVRLFEANTTTPDHRFIVGIHATNVVIRNDGTNIRKKYTITYGSGGSIGKIEEATHDYIESYPRHEYIRAESINDAGTARHYARILLKANSSNQRRGSIRVVDSRSQNLQHYGITKGYDIESIEPGHTVQLSIERPIDNINPMIAGIAIPGRAEFGYSGYGENLVVHQVNWEYDSAVLTFTRPKPDAIRDLIRIERSIQRVRNRN